MTSRNGSQKKKPTMTNETPIKLPAGRYQSVLGYAKDLGITTEGVLKRIQRKEVRAYRVGKAWIIKLDKKTV